MYLFFKGKLLPEKADLATNKPVPKMRNKTSAGSRPRPKTIHVDSGGVGSGVDMQEGILSPSRSKKGSTSNLTGNISMWCIQSSLFSCLCVFACKSAQCREVVTGLILFTSLKF